MAGAPTAGRVLRLPEPLRRRPRWTAAVLAAELAVTGRSVRRDVDHVRALGHPVLTTPGAGEGTGSAPAPACPRCCRTTRKPSPRPSARAPPAAPSPASTACATGVGDVVPAPEVRAAARPTADLTALAAPPPS